MFLPIGLWTTIFKNIIPDSDSGGSVYLENMRISLRICQQHVVSAQFMILGRFRPNGRLGGKSPWSPGS